jgi:hypothetical protein
MVFIADGGHGVLQVFTNGVFGQDNTFTPFTLSTGPFPLVIGSMVAQTDSAQTGFYGAIADVRIYNRALSTNEVLQLYAYESTPPSSPPCTPVVIAPPFIPQPTMGITALSLLSFTNLAVGTNYQLQSLVGGTLFNVGAAFTAAGSTFTQYVSGTAAPNGYRLAVTPVPDQAFATAQVVNGFVVGATVTSGGSGYTTNPVVSILNDAGGSNATAIASMSGGTVTGITITDAGIGYTNAPSILIQPPPATAFLPMVTQVMELSFGSLSPYDNYQLEFSPNASGAWSSIGGPFTSAATTKIQYVNTTGNVGFFRVRYVP